VVEGNMPELVGLRREGPIARIVLSNGERLNALSDAMIAALHARLDETAADGETRVVILSGEGRAFCAGHDLKEMQAARQAPDGGAAAHADLFDRCAAMMLAIQRHPCPVIAQVHGVAVAAGCQLAATCDLVVADKDARFGVNGVNIGLFCSTPMVALTRAVGRKAAFEMLVTGRLIGADEAMRIGLANRVAEDVAEAAGDLATTIAGKLGSAVRVGKRAFYEQAEMGVEDAYAHAGRVMAWNMADADTSEGIDAFLEKRPPAWSV
jgi:enoyl-CoA hydratase/carnithine racemase